MIAYCKYSTVLNATLGLLTLLVLVLYERHDPTDGEAAASRKSAEKYSDESMLLKTKSSSISYYDL